MELDLKNKTALVGGSTSGIGKAIAKKYAEANANVILIARNEDKLKNTIEELDTSNNQEHNYIIADFTHPEQVKENANNFLTNYSPGIDILVNNTGGPPAGPVLEADVDEFLRAYKMHLACNQILTKLVIDNMKDNKWGRIINIISTSVRQPISNLGVSNTTRGAVGNWSKTLANEIGKYNITVNNILPGSTRTQRLVSILQTRADNSNRSFEEVEKEMEESIPLKRIGEPEEIANAALFLASEAASYVSGTNLIVDGGRTKCY